MPNTSNDDVIIVGSLSDNELRDSIDELVDYVGNKTTIMAGKFDVAMEKMKSAMKDFAITQKVSVDLMQDAWKQMSASFDAMLKAQQNATSSGNNSGTGGGNSQYADNTVGHLQEIIALEEKRRKEMQLGSDALRDQNKLIEEQKAKLKGETTSDQVKAAQAAKKELQEAFTMPARGLADAEKKLQQLQSLSAKFQGKGILDQTQWNRLNAQIQATQEKIDKLRQKKPTSIQDVLGMDESSVDAIAKKMAALKKVTVDPQNTAQVKQLGDEYQRLKRLQAELMGQNIQMTHSNNYLAQSFGYIRNRLVYAMTLGAITSFTKQVYEIRGQYELLERSLGVLVNSFERGSQIFQELNQMAIESPFTLMELAGAAKQLTAYNFAANEVVDTTRRLADISAALGVPMERLTYNLGQIRAQTVLTARDARDFANAGLPIVASLAEHFTELEGKIVTTGDVYDRMSKKMVSYSDVMAVLNKMTDEGGKFFEFQAKQAETLRVQMANLNLAWNNMLNEMGENNQTLLSLPMQGLKALFQNWASLSRVLKNVVLSFGLLRVAQMIAIRHNWQLAASAGGAARTMGFLGNAANKLAASLGALAANPWTWISVGIFALVDLIGQMRAAKQATAELNEEIRNGATEASQANVDFLSNKGNIETRKLAKESKLTAEQGEKAWEAISEQISTSAMSANQLLGTLLAIPDINERVAAGFDYAERIQKAQAALEDLKDTQIDMTHDKGWWGLFGEGLVSDLKDLKEELGGIGGQMSMFTKDGKVNADLGTGFAEYAKELEVTANSIKNFLDAYNIKDPLQIQEILSRVKAQIKIKNPEIKGELATLFDVTLDQRMNYLTNGAIDNNASLWAMFMERLKHNSSSAFQDITNEWIKNDQKLSKEQQEAVDKNLEYFKNTMPFYYDTVKSMVDDASKLKIHIGIAFNVQQLSDFQKEVNQRIGNSVGVLDFGGGAFLPTNNDNLSSWVKTQQQAIKSLGEENKKYALDDTQWSKEKIAANDREIQQRKNLLDLFNQQYAEEKKGRKGGNRKPEDVVAEALKQELQLIREMQSNYDKLRKSGVSNMDAIDLASKGYEATIIRINQVLSKFGIDKFNAANFAGKDVRSLLQSLEEQRKALLASGKVKTSSLQALDVEIQKLTVDAKTYDMKKVTDGLNSELGKIKDEYELAIELDANPELGNMFAEMFGIDTSTFPRTVNEYMQRVQQEFDNARLNLNLGAQLDVFRANTEQWYKWGESVGYSKEQVDNFKKSFDGSVGIVKKWAQDIVKQTQDLQYKLADNNGKIAIEEEKLANLRQRLAQETNEKQRQLLELQIQDQQNTIDKLKESILEMLPTYQRAFGQVAEHSAWMTRRLMQDYKTMLVNAQKAGKNKNGKYVITDPISGEKAEVTENKLGKEIKNADKELQKTQSTVKKITEAFKKGEDGVVDWVHGVELVGEELGKLGQFVDVVGNIVDAFSNPNEYNATAEAIHDIATSLQGVATAAQGIGQIASGDYIGGAVNVASGLFSAISSWFDNADKDILAKIEDSERAVKRLELAYIDLEHAVNEAYGMATIGANMAAKANKELQLVELKRQLALERSRDGKHQDEDRIIDLQKQIKELEYDIQDTVESIVNDLLGISSVGDAMENMMDAFIEALRSGEDAMATFDENVDEMIANMVKKMFTTKILQPWFEEQWNKVKKSISSRANELTWDYVNFDGQNSSMPLQEFVVKTQKVLEEVKSGGGGEFFDRYKALQGEWVEVSRETWIKQTEEILKKAQDELNDAYTPTVDDLKYYAKLLRSGQPILEEQMNSIEDILRELGLFGDKVNEQKLSALQQGIQGVTEDTAGAIEAYMNIVAQRVFEQNLYLQEIRDHLNNFDLDVQLGTLSQMLLQLQQSYQVQQNIESILTGVLNPSGRAIVVELNS